MNADITTRPDARRHNGREHPRLVSVQPPATRPAPLAAHPDERLSAAILAARADGRDAGERDAWPRGWRAGVGHGLVAGLLVGALAMYAGLQIAAMLGGK